MAPRTLARGALAALLTTLAGCGQAELIEAPAPGTVVVVELSPATATLLTGRSRQFTASVAGTDDTAVWWSLREGSAGGTVTSDGLYTAPAAAGTWHVVVTSQADPARAAAATVTVTEVGVSLSPPSASLVVGQVQAFTASVTGTDETAVTWSVEEGPGGGTVTSGGLYTAPATAGTFHVVATSQADPGRAARAAVAVSPPPVTAVTVEPGTASLLTGAAQQFLATVTGGDGREVAWSVREGASGGTVTAGGLYTAPSTAGTFHVVATSQADPARSDAATVTVTEVGVTLSPSSAWIATGRTQPFTAAVTGTADGAVTWSVQERGGGTVTAGGLYAAPATPGTFHVVATSHADPRRTATAAVTVGEVAISIAPDAAALDVGDVLRLTATVAGSPDPGVTWSVLEGAWCGAVVDGHYRAPDAPGTCHVVATSVADPTRSASAEITIASPGPATIWDVRLGTGVIDGGPRAGTWDLDPAGHPDTLVVVQTPNATAGPHGSVEVFFGPVGGPLAAASLPVAAASGVAQPTAVMDTSTHKLHVLAPAGNLFSLIYLRAAVQRGPDGRISGFTKEAEVAFSPPTGSVYGAALVEVVDGAGNHRLAGVMAVDAWFTGDSWIHGFVTSVAGGVAPTAPAQFTGLGGGAALETLATFQHTGGAGALDGAYGCMSSMVQQPTTGTIYAFSARGLHGASTDFHRIFPIALTAAGATTWAPAPAINYSDTGTGSNFAVALPTGHVYWSWEDGTDSRISRVNPDGSLNLAPLPALGFRAEFNPGACHVAVQGDRVMTILHEWGDRVRVHLATGVDHDAPGTSPVAWQVTELRDPNAGQYPLLATGVEGLGRAGGHWWTAMLSAHYSSVHVDSWLLVAPFP